MFHKTDNTINHHIGTGLNLARIVRGLSLVELAMASGIPPARLERIECGEVECSARELFMIADVLSVPVDYFFDGVALPIEDFDPGEQRSLHPATMA